MAGLANELRANRRPSARFISPPLKNVSDEMSDHFRICFCFELVSSRLQAKYRSVAFSLTGALRTCHHQQPI